MTNVQDEQRAQTRLALGAMLIPIFFVIGFATCIIGAYHKPHPNDIQVAVVGPPAQTAQLRAAMAKAGGAAFEIRQATTVAQAEHDVRQRELDAAFVPTADQTQPATVIVADAGGRIVATAAEVFARSVATAQGAQLVVRDVRPLPSGDQIGLGVFMFMIVCTICGYFAATLLFTVAPALAPIRRYAIIAAISVLAPALVYLIAGVGFGTYSGSFGTILAFIAVGALYVFVIGLITRLLQVLLGPPALFVSLAIFVFLNIPSLGATYTEPVLPGFWRFLNQFWIGAETVNAERSILYFGGQDVGTDLLRLLAWTGVIVLLLALPVSRKLAGVRSLRGPADRAAAGRGAECEFLDAALTDARKGHSRVVVLRGEAGAGKSVLLDYTTGRADGWRVVTAVGIESEMELAYSGLHQLCAPMLDHLERLPVPQRDALRTVFGRQTGPAPDRFLVGLAILTLVAEVAEEQPVLCLIDDGQWLDTASAQILVFVARRLLAERIAVVCAARTVAGAEALAGLPSLPVARLGPVAARALLLENVQGRFDAEVCEQIVTESHGNPLALLELPRTWNVADLAGGFGHPARHPVAGKIEQSYITRLQALPAETQLLVVVAAAEPLGDPLLLQRAVEHLGFDMTAAGPAVDAGLLDVGARIRFAHPLVRSAAYQSATDADRHRVHRALAEATDPEREADRRAWHRARGTVGPDEAVAAELEDSAGRAQARGGVAAAAAFLERAAALSPDPARRARRSLAAAGAKQLAGAPEAASRLLVAALDGRLDDLETAAAQRLRGEIALDLRRSREAVPLLLDAARRFEARKPELARDTYLQALQAGSVGGRLATDLRRHAAEVARDAPPPQRDPRPVDLLVAGLAVRFTDGYVSSAKPLKRALRALLGEDGGGTQHVRWPGHARRLAFDLFDDEMVRAITTRSVELARTRGALGVLPLALDFLAMARTYAGEFDAAETLLQESEAIAEATGAEQIGAARLTLAGFRGDEAVLSRLSGVVEPLASARGDGMVLTFGEHARALVHNGSGRYEAALPEAESAGARDELAVSVLSLPEVVEAAARCGRDRVAADALERLSERTQAAGTDWALGIEARARALTTSDEELYVEAIDRLGQIPPEQARAHLLYGEWLRRAARRVDAREQLRAAHSMLATIGMDAFAERARRELEATGVTVRKRRPDARDELTAQEAQIAQLAREGHSNPEIASQLFLSSRTVEWHLRKVFAKLGISSRRELETALRAESTV